MLVLLFQFSFSLMKFSAVFLWLVTQLCGLFWSNLLFHSQDKQCHFNNFKWTHKGIIKLYHDSMTKIWLWSITTIVICLLKLKLVPGLEIVQYVIQNKISVWKNISSPIKYVHSSNMPRFVFVTERLSKYMNLYTTPIFANTKTTGGETAAAHRMSRVNIYDQTWRHQTDICWSDNTLCLQSGSQTQQWTGNEVTSANVIKISMKTKTW